MLVDLRAFTGCPGTYHRCILRNQVAKNIHVWNLGDVRKDTFSCRRERRMNNRLPRKILGNSERL